MLRTTLIILFVILLAQSCSKENGTGGSFSPTPYSAVQPPHFPQLPVSGDNISTEEGVALGRKLYYDPILSNNGLSCSSCHLQNIGFTSMGTVGGTTVLPHINLGWNTNFLWDGKVKGDMEDIMMFEVHDFFQTDISKLNRNMSYRNLFKQAFDTDYISEKDVANALAQFIRTMVSWESKMDQFLQHQGSLSPSEMRGFVVFNTEKGDCFHCHTLPLMTDNQFHNIGLDSVPSGSGLGAFLITGQSTDAGKFKTPTLRNAGLRNKYMHDGRFSSLMEVVEHYNSGVHMHSPNLDPILTKPGKEHGLELTAQDKADLVNFLNAMTDQKFITNPALSNPF